MPTTSPHPTPRPTQPQPQTNKHTTLASIALLWKIDVEYMPSKEAPEEEAVLVGPVVKVSSSSPSACLSMMS